MMYCYVFISVHEKTLIQALEMLSLWCNKFSNEVPKKMMDWLQVLTCLRVLYSVVMFYVVSNVGIAEQHR